MLRRLLACAAVFALLATASFGLTAGCSGKVIPQGGVMLVFDTDGTLPQSSSFHFDVSVPGAAPFYSIDQRIPSEIQLPQTFAVVSNGVPSATAIVNTDVRDENGKVLDDREDQILEVPTERLAELRIVFSARCSGLAVTLPDGGAASSCEAGTTCDPDTAACVSNEVNASTLPTFTGDAGPPDTVSRAGDATLPTDAAGEAGQGDADDGDAGASGEGGGGSADHFALLRNVDGGAALGGAYLDSFGVDGSALTSLPLSTLIAPFSLETGIPKTLSAGGNGVLYVAGRSAAPGSAPDAGDAVIAAVTRAGTVTAVRPGAGALVPGYAVTSVDGINFVWASGSALQLCDGGTCTTFDSAMGVGQLTAFDGVIYFAEGQSPVAVERLLPDGGLSAPLFYPSQSSGFALLDVSNGGYPDLAYVSSGLGIARWSPIGNGMFGQDESIASIPSMASVAAAPTGAATVNLLSTASNGVQSFLCTDFLGADAGATCTSFRPAGPGEMLLGVAFVPGAGH